MPYPSPENTLHFLEQCRVLAPSLTFCAAQDRFWFSINGVDLGRVNSEALGPHRSNILRVLHSFEEEQYPSSIYGPAVSGVVPIATVLARHTELLAGANASDFWNPPPKQQQSGTSGVYLVQLLDRPNTVKIGWSKNSHTRLKEVQTTYGPLRPILLIPHDHPRILERQLHARFAPMRVYEGASATELFTFTTRAQQKALEAFVHEQAPYRVHPVTWTLPPRRPDTDERQVRLF